jgi:hypothetical protein
MIYKKHNRQRKNRRAGADQFEKADVNFLVRLYLNYNKFCTAHNVDDILDEAKPYRVHIKLTCVKDPTRCMMKYL